jgi:microcystin-dependent protein
MPLQIPVRAVAGALPTGTQWTPQQLSEEILKRASFFWDGAIGFQNGGTMPTSNVGPWLKGGTDWMFWNVATGTYDLTVFQTGDIKMFGGSIDESKGWLLCDGRQFATTDYPALFGVLGYNFLNDSDKSGGTPIDPTKFRVPNFQGRSPIGVGTEGITRTLGGRYGASTVTLDPNQIPPLTIQLQARNVKPDAATPRHAAACVKAAIVRPAARSCAPARPGRSWRRQGWQNR